MRRYTEAEVLQSLRRRVKEAKSQREAATELKIGEATLSDTLSTGRLWPRVTKAMGLKRVVLYEREAS